MSKDSVSMDFSPYRCVMGGLALVAVGNAVLLFLGVVNRASPWRLFLLCALKFVQVWGWRNRIKCIR